MFDLVTEPEVFGAQRALQNEMRPQIEELISRAEGGLEGLKERERTLRAKVRCRFRIPTGLVVLVRVFLCFLTFSSPSSQVDKRAASSSRAETPIAADQKDLDALEQKLAELRQRKERLGREVELLEEKAGAH